MDRQTKKRIEISLIWLGIGIVIWWAIYPSVDNWTTYTLLPWIILIYLSIFFSH